MLEVPPVRAPFLGTKMMKRNVEGKFRVLSHHSLPRTVISQPGLHQSRVFHFVATPLDDHLVDFHIKVEKQKIKIVVFLVFSPTLVVEALMRHPLPRR